jgi:hypothetical protein
MDFASPSSNSSSVSHLNMSRLMKLHYSPAQFDIQSVANDGNLNDVRMVNLVRHRFIVRRPRYMTPLKYILSLGTAQPNKASTNGSLTSGA